MSSEREGTLREAARKLIGAYMADDDLAPHINALEAAAGFTQQGSEHEPVPAPSDEAMEVAVAVQLALGEKLNERDRAINDALRSLDNLKGHRCREQAAFLAHIDSIQQTLIAATAGTTHMPRREAEVRAEERAATLRALESNEALNVAAAAFENRIGSTHGVGDGLRAALAAVVAHFNPEAE